MLVMEVDLFRALEANGVDTAEGPPGREPGASGTSTFSEVGLFCRIRSIKRNLFNIHLN